MTLVNLPLKRIKISGHVCKCNSTNTILGADETFTGEWEDISDYGIAFVNVKSDVASAEDGLQIQQSSDGVNADHDDVYTIPAGTGKNFSINPHAKYVRIVYVNGSTQQGYFRLQTVLKGNSKPSSHRIQDSISSDDDATLTKAVITGQTPAGVFTNFQATTLGNFKVAVQEYGDTPSIDAFGRLRVSDAYTIFDSKQLHDKQPLFWDELTGGSATSEHDSSIAAVKMTVTASASDYVQRQTKQFFNYQPGKALKNGEPVLTCDGFKHIEDLKIGEKVFDGEGNLTEIIGVYPQGIRKIYRIIFDDETHIDCDGDHLWKTIVRQNSKKGESRILTTNEMLSEYGEFPPQFARWRIPASPILQIENKHVTIDPYTMGCILGDGSIDNMTGFVTITNPEKEIIDNLVCEEITDRKRDISFGLRGLGKYICNYGLKGTKSNTKFIPDVYLLNDYDTRLSVLRGLMDTDGSVDKRDGTCEYNSASIHLAEGLAFLVRSIGGQAIVRKRPSFYNDEDGNKIQCLDSYRVRVISPICPFQLSRKAFYWKKRERISFDRYIHSIIELGEFEATCIRVDSSDHTFLTRNNIVTHNSHLAFLTAHMPQQTGCKIRVGSFIGSSTNYLTPKDGIFLEVTENDISWNIAKNGVIEESVNQANWNNDTLDGTGASGFTLDMDAVQIIVYDMEYLGVGRVRVGFIINGLYVYCHYFNHANDPTFDSVYMLTPNLPLRYSIESDGTGGGTLDHICGTVISEGGQQQTGILRSVDTNTVHLDADAADTHYIALAIRLKSLYRDITVIPEYFSMISETNDDFLWSILLNPTYAGTLTFNDITNSAVQYAIGATANTISDRGIIIDSGYSKSSSNIDRRVFTALKIGSQIDSTLDVLALAACPLSSNADLQSSLTFRELL